MPSHPSLEGLREALIERLCNDYELYPVAPMGEAPLSRSELAEMIDTLLQAQADYLRPHGVGWFGEGLVRAVYFEGCGVEKTFLLLHVPSEAEPDRG